MKRFTLMAIAALALIFAVTSCDNKKPQGSITYKLMKGTRTVSENEPLQLPLHVVITPENTKVKSVSFVFTGVRAGVEKVFDEIKVEKDAGNTDISSLGDKADVNIVLSRTDEPLKSAKQGMEIASYQEGTYKFIVKTKDGQESTFSFKISPYQWTKVFPARTIVNINAEDKGSLNLVTGNTVSISVDKSERYLMNNSDGPTFKAGFTSESVTIKGKKYEGNGCEFYKVMAADHLTFDSDPMAVAGVSIGASKANKMVKTIDGLAVNDLVIGYLTTADKRSHAFLIKVKAIDPNAGTGTNKGSMTLEWKYFTYMMGQ